MAAFVGYCVQANGICFPWNIQGPLGISGATSSLPAISFADISAAGGPADQWDALPTAAKLQILGVVGFLEMWSETSAALETLRDAGFVDARASAADAADGLGPTCWTHRPLFRIDHALLSPALAACAEVVRYARVLDDASDHYAICVDLEFPVDSTGDPDRS